MTGEAATSGTRARRGRHKGHEEDERTEQARGAMEREEGGRPRSGVVEMRGGGWWDTVENAEAARQSTVVALC